VIDLKAKMALMLSLVLGLITTLLFFQYMRQFNTEKVATVETMEVVVAKEKIEKNEKISANKLELIIIPKESVLPQAVISIEDVEGKLANALIEKGEAILTHRIGSEIDESVYVSRKVRDGYRAVSVGVNINQSVSNLMEPEDEVDVVSSKMVKDAANKDIPQTVLLLKKARVLAVGRKMQTAENKDETYVEYSSVTLELKPEDAIKLINATEEGKIHFILNKRPLIPEENKPNDKE
jgi:pilus assembly protein CpaB